MYLKRLLLVSIVVLAGCVAPIKKGEPLKHSESNAYVIVAIAGNMMLSEARYCSAICTAWYSFGDEKINAVHVFPVSVGRTFIINQVHSYGKVASFKGKEIEIQSPGVYYFGVIVSQDGRLGYRAEPNDIILKEALNKYGDSLASLTPYGFAWPEL